MGKSYSLLADAIRDAWCSNHRALLIRRTLGELTELIDKSRFLFPKAYPGAKFRESDKTWKFPSGATLLFGYCDTDQDVTRYVGQAYSWIGVDELTHFATPYVWEMLTSRCRTTDERLTPYMRACVDDGEVLTENGWKFIGDVKENEYVYGLTSEGELVKRKVHTSVVYDVDEQLVRIKKKNLYMSMTQDHRVLYKPDSNKQKYKIIRWNEHKNQRIEIARTSNLYNSGGYASPLNNFSDNNYAKFLGLYIAEGCVTGKNRGNYKVLITQNKKENHTFVKNTMEAGGYNVCYSRNGDFQITNKELYFHLEPLGKAYQKHFPREFLNNATQEQLKIAFDAYILGDGCWQSNSSCTAFTSSKQLADDLQEMAIKLGYKTQLHHEVYDNPNWNDKYTIYFAINSTTTQVDKGVKRNNTKLVDYKGKVYCIGVEEIETFFLRQNGCVWCSSNTTNPGGIGGWWVKKMFVDPAEWNTAFWATDIETGEVKTFPDNEFVDADLRGKPLFKRRFIPAKLTDNPYLTRSPEYMASLSSMNEVQRRRLLEGDWDVAEDTAFPEFDRKRHVINTFELNGEEVEAIPENIPLHWRRVRACDYGFVAGTAVLWFAISPDGTIYVYRELYTKGLDAKELAEKIIELEWDEPPSIKGMLDHDSFARKGGPTNAEIMNKMGLKWAQAEKGPGSRINGKNTVHRVLKNNPLTGKPFLQIFSSCSNLSRVFPVLPLEKDRSTGMPKEDVDTNYPEDHLYDALRYGVNSRQIKPTELPQERSWRQRTQRWQPMDTYVGY